VYISVRAKIVTPPPPARTALKPLVVALFGWFLYSTAAGAAGAPLELHHRITPAHAASAAGATGAPQAALTLDACGGAYDADLINLLVRLRVPATLFVTQRWLTANPAATAQLLAHPDLFEFENHGTQHVPAVLGFGRRLYGMAGAQTASGLRAEVQGAATAITRATDRAPQFFRGAGAAYDSESLLLIAGLKHQVAGFSLNADAGATLPAAAVARALQRLQPGEVVIAHMNKPAGGTAEGFAAALPLLLQRGFKFVKLSQVQLVAVP
jgi:peptidoglycan/xylan/chitin deacetylase (PgdA/CDA1 family)